MMPRLACWLVLLLVVSVTLSLASEGPLAWKPTQCGPGNIMTQWGHKVDPNNVLPEYPR